MVQAKKDLRVYLSKHETELFKQMVINLGQVETLMAHQPDLIPLDVFLDFSELVSQSFYMYGNAIGLERSVSWNRLNRLFQRLIPYYIDAQRVLKDSDNEILSKLSQVVSFIDMVREHLTLADIVNR